MSAQTYNLLAEVPDMQAMGIDILRLSPQPAYMPEIIAAFDTARHAAGTMEGIVPAPKQEWADNGFVDGYWFGEAGIVARHQMALNTVQGV